MPGLKCKKEYLRAENMAESDHYARNIYLNVFLKIAVLWILATFKIPS